MKFWIKAISLIVCIVLLHGAVACDNGGNETVTETREQTETIEKDTLASDTESDTESDTVTDTVTETDTETITETETEAIPDVEIVEDGGGATVTVKSGLAYTAKNYLSVEESAFVINQGFEISFEDGLFAEEFNRFSIEYEASEPIKMTATYTMDGEEVNDVFYIEAIKTSFRGLIDSYLDGKCGAQIKKLTFDTCEEVEARIILHSLTTETIPLYEDDLSVEDDRFKIGVRLSWGGAMTYYEDKEDGIDDLGNLVNIHDTGRLIQQSFYGTKSNGEYVSGIYSGGTVWPYNPVQGGNKYQSGRPKLIDVEVGEDYIYILAQSLDWAHDNSLTYTYYENKYTIMDGYVLVDNVATDFSGWSHGAGGQEIPAVYLIGYFDTLVYYNGAEPWTGGELIYESDIGNWGKARRIIMTKENTETWATWLNTADGFGIGIYAPNIDNFIAIRHNFNGSKDPMNDGTVYVAPQNSITMKSYDPIIYSYILTSGSVEEIRELFAEKRDFTDNADLDDRHYNRISSLKVDMTDMDFSLEGTEELFCGARHCSVSYDEEQEAAKIYVEDGRDPYVYLYFYANSDRTLMADDYNAVEIEYMIPEANSKKNYNTTLFLCSGEITGAKDEYAVNGVTIADGEYHTMMLRLPEHKWSGEMHEIRYDFFHSAEEGDVIYVKSIKFTNYPMPQIENYMTDKGSETFFTLTRNTAVEFDETEEAMMFTVMDPDDVYVEIDYSHLALLARKYSSVEIEYMIPTSNQKPKYGIELFLCAGDDTGYAQARTVRDMYVCDGEYHTITLPLTEEKGWSGLARKIRFDYFNACAKDDVIYIKSIKLLEDPNAEPFDFTVEGSENLLSLIGKTTTVEYSAEEQAVKLTVADPRDVKVEIKLEALGLYAEDHTEIEIVYKIPVSNSASNYYAEVFFCTGEDSGYAQKRATTQKYICDGQYHIATISFDGKEGWTGLIKKIRFDYFGACAVGDVIYIKSITMIK